MHLTYLLSYMILEAPIFIGIHLISIILLLLRNDTATFGAVCIELTDY